MVQVQRRARGAFDIDEWGLDPELVALANPIFGLRWDIEVRGGDQLPAVGGAVLVFNRRFGVSEPWVVARGIRQATGRFVRTVGVPDVAPVGPFIRRFGGVLDRTDEIAGLLRAGQLVGLPMSRALRSPDPLPAAFSSRVRRAAVSRRKRSSSPASSLEAAGPAGPDCCSERSDVLMVRSSPVPKSVR